MTGRGRAAGLRDVLGRLRPVRRHPLGEGLWRGDFDRVDRASRRVLQVLAGRDDDGLVAELTACREVVWQCCVAAYARAPDVDREVPGDDDLAAAHRAMSRAATAVAQAAQALVMAGDLTGPDALAPARRAVALAVVRAEEARSALSG